MRFLAACCLMYLTTSCIEALPVGGPSVTPTNTLPPVWGEWSAWSECSRNCGSGVSIQQRVCIDNCITEEQVEKRYRSCCVQDCPEGSPDFREEQCLRLRELRSDGNWSLADKGNEECTLLCQDAQGGSGGKLRFLQSYVVPGTSCTTGLGERGVCLGDQCAVVGCDGVLGSGRKEDGCLRCQTEESAGNTVCHHYADTVSHPPPPVNGSVSILNLPVSSTSLSISHTLSCAGGRLALKSADNEYLFQNGFNGTSFDIAGTTFIYQIMDNATEGYTEELSAIGPLTAAIKVELQGVAMGTTPTLSYSYHLLEEEHSTQPTPSHAPHEPHPPADAHHHTFQWRYMALSNCSQSCGRGLQTLVPKCVDVDYPDRMLADGVCAFEQELEKPLPIVSPCNLQDCPPTWVTGDWSQCSKDCGGGEQTRHVECRQPTEEGQPPALLANSSSCSEATRPADVQQCNVQECHDGVWVTGQWSECSETLREGVQCRSVQCQGTASGLPLDHAQCSESTKPSTTKACRLTNLIEGKYYGWVARKWKSKCDNPCGKGVQTRNVKCQEVEGKVMNESFCAGLEQPPTERECWDDRRSKCTPLWHEGEFGECTGNCCDQQLQYRAVTCRAVSENQPITFPDEFCAPHPKPNATRECERSDCPAWEISDWGACSAECGEKGLHTRQVQCVHSTGLLADKSECCGNALEEAKVCDGPTCAPCSDQVSHSTCLQLAWLCTVDTSVQQLCCATCRGMNS